MPAAPAWRPTSCTGRPGTSLPRVLDAAGLDRAVLLGHSDGGSIALLAAARHPDRVAALALEAPHVFVEDLSVASIAAIGERYRRDPDLRRRLAAHHAHVDEVFRGWNDVWLSAAFRAWNIEDEVAAVQCPVLVLQGADDEYGTTAQIDAIAPAVERPSDRDRDPKMWTQPAPRPTVRRARPPVPIHGPLTWMEREKCACVRFVTRVG